jgi:ppGpp synthetase/RelA/SpoT-type nucleotidyltranferase
LVSHLAQNTIGRRPGVDDYILSPKNSGYRSVHLLYKYNSDKKAPSIYNGLFIEVKIRSRLQHAWATAVETVVTFLQQALKSSQGEEEWLRFLL